MRKRRVKKIEAEKVKGKEKEPVKFDTVMKQELILIEVNR